jgi:peptide/nickel transport system ATP-binding protein
MAGIGVAHLRADRSPVLAAEHVVVRYPSRHGAPTQAVSDVSFDLLEGETLGIVGESGCGKSSLGRALLAFPPPTSGRVLLDGEDLTALPRRELRRARARLQMVFQDPISSLNPRRKVAQVLEQPLRIWDRPTAGRAAQVEAALAAVGLDPAVVGDRRPGELSGGQCQRLCIARALMVEPAVLICDEPVSSLDVSVQAQILNLLEDLKAERGLSMVFVAHDLAVVRNISDRVLVMYLGRVCEVAPSADLWHAAHPYTELLLSSIPELEAGAARSADHAATPAGELPSAAAPPSGCRFRTRCLRADDRCAAEAPELREVGDDHWVACHHPLDQPVALAATRQRRPADAPFEPHDLEVSR